MKKILTIPQGFKIAKHLNGKKRKIVLAGGCFDILHLGHIAFFEKAKKAGDDLILLLESDDSIRMLKGVKRPVNIQINRAKVLEAIRTVDFIVLLSKPFKTEDYNLIVKNISPAIIAVTSGDPNLRQKKIQAKSVGGKIKIVTEKIPDHSTTKLLGYF